MKLLLFCAGLTASLTPAAAQFDPISRNLAIQAMKRAQTAQTTASSSATKADLANEASARDAAIAAATGQMATAAALNGLAASIPAPSSAVPSAETIGGAMGTSGAFMRADAKLPRITRAVMCATNSSGQCSVTWTAIATTPVVLPIAVIPANATMPIECFPVSGTITTTGATVQCFTGQSAVVSALGTTVLPFAKAAAGVTVQIFAIPPAS